MIESIEKLRKWVKSLYTPNSGELKVEGLDIADEIEAEIAEKYMELPVDADGVPIRVGDMVSLNGREPFEVGGVRDTRNQWHVFPYDLQRWYAPLDLHHVKPRTIEDVLADFASKQHGITKEENDALIAECADEIRELMEVD